MKFIISQKPEGAYQFSLKDEYGKNILWSPRFSSKNQCINGINQLRNNISVSIEVDQWQTDSGRYLFHLRCSDGRLLAMSAPFISKHECNHTITEIRKRMSEAVEQDVTIVFEGY